MALQTSGIISLNDIHIEAGGSSGTEASINDSDIRSMIGKSSGAQSSFSEFYGASSSVWDKSKNPAVYGGPWNGSGPGQTGSGSGNASTYQMNASAGSSNANMGLVTVIPLKKGTTYECDYDVTLNGTSTTTTLSLANNQYGYSSGISSIMAVSKYISTEWTLCQTAYWNGGGSYYTDNDGNWSWLTNNNSFRAAAKFQFTTNSSYDWKGVGLVLSQGRNGNGNWENGSCTIHKCIISEV